ncbi:MAG: transposase [Alphaproteobacteria bacterium]|nr:transposase [Alphaproteobacteria bacterium]
MEETGISIADPIPLNPNCVFKELAARGKTTMERLYSLKSHLMINHKGICRNL